MRACEYVCVIVMGSGGEREEQGYETRVFMPPALSLTDHRLNFTCMNDLAIVTEIFLTRFPWRISLSLFL